MNANEIRRLAHAINEHRPDWPVSSLTTFITRELAKHTYRDAAVALTWVAVDQKPDGSPASETPKRVTEGGPWWRAACIEGEQTLTPPKRDEQCRVCGRRLGSCICGNQATKPTPPAAPQTVAEALAAARAAIAQTNQEEAHDAR